jgi:hypothetical protein
MVRTVRPSWSTDGHAWHVAAVNAVARSSDNVPVELLLDELEKMDSFYAPVQMTGICQVIGWH